MKFGAQMKYDAIPEWRSAYLNYKALKKRIGKMELENETAFTSTIVPISLPIEEENDKQPLNGSPLTPKEAEFFPQLDAEIQKVEEFLQTNIASSTDRLANILVKCNT
jgi:SPX domain protein involved in polyphosphate accumulation